MLEGASDEWWREIAAHLKTRADLYKKLEDSQRTHRYEIPRSSDSRAQDLYLIELDHHNTKEDQ
jgi:hypothetical protein